MVNKEIWSEKDTTSLDGKIESFKGVLPQRSPVDISSLEYILNSVIIRPHDKPDPDAVASALLMDYILEKNNIPSVILYSSDSDNYMNKQLAIDLDLKSMLIPTKSIVAFHGKDVFNNMKYSIFVDTETPELQISHSKNMAPTLSIDHHKQSGDKNGNGNKDFMEIYKQTGACTSILLNYMADKEYDLSNPELRRLRIASYLGIKTDTNNFHRKRMTHIDDRALKYLEDFMNEDDFMQCDYISDPILDKDIMGHLGKALVYASENVAGDKSIIYALPEPITSKDSSIIQYLADELFNRRKHFGARSVFVYGIIEPDMNNGAITKVRVAARSADKDDARDVVAESFYNTEKDPDKTDEHGQPIYIKKVASGGRKTPEGYTIAGGIVNHPDISDANLQELWPGYRSMYKKRLYDTMGIKMKDSEQ